MACRSGGLYIDLPLCVSDESWHLLAGSVSGELSGSGEAQAEALWWGHRPQVALVNTVAFKGVWQKQFMFTNTQNLPFVLSDGNVIKVPMMYQAAEVSFGKRRCFTDTYRLLIPPHSLIYPPCFQVQMQIYQCFVYNWFPCGLLIEI